jgi:hypothetical protein
VDDPLAQAIHYENADKFLFATFVLGLAGEPGRQLRYANPPTMEKALQIALSVEKAEKQENSTKHFMLDSIVRSICRHVHLAVLAMTSVSDDAQLVQGVRSVTRQSASQRTA